MGEIVTVPARVWTARLEVSKYEAAPNTKGGPAVENIGASAGAACWGRSAAAVINRRKSPIGRNLAQRRPIANSLDPTK